MSNQQGQHPIRGVIAGIAGGLVAAWVMNQFTAKAGPPLKKVIESPEQLQADAKQAQDGPQQDATMKTADAIAATATGGQHLTFEQQQKGGPVVHYTFGALMGGLYGLLAEYSSAVRSGFGTTFGSALFTGADLLAVPALNLSGSPTDQPSALATPFASHLVYGATTELVRRLVRKVV